MSRLLGSLWRTRINSAEAAAWNHAKVPMGRVPERRRRNWPDGNAVFNDARPAVQRNRSDGLALDLQCRTGCRQLFGLCRKFAISLGQGVQLSHKLPTPAG